MLSKEKFIAFLVVVVAIAFGGYVFSRDSLPEKSSLKTDPVRAILDPFDAVSGASSNKDASRDALRFSSTAKWDKQFLDQTKLESKFVPNWRQVIVLPLPPANTSTRTNEELALLRSYRDTLRTPERVKNILAEADPATTKFGDFMITDYLDAKKFPATAAVLNPVWKDFSVVVFSMKQKYDRVRPSVLDTSLAPIIAVPGHPAYPSGHSSQAHFLAYFLGELMPDKAKAFEDRADEIAINREIAGFHYQSDTKAGQMLARQYMDIVLNSPEFRASLQAARSEWQKN